MMIHLLLFGIGLLTLYFGAEWLVRGSAHLAQSWGVSSLAVGLTIVAFGSSAPELVVATLAAVEGHGDVAIGNVIGSNILNIALILGLTSLVYPVEVQLRLLAREVPVMIASAVIITILALDLGYGRAEGILLLVAFVAYLWFVGTAAQEEPVPHTDAFEKLGEEDAPKTRIPHLLWDFIRVALGLVGLAVGAHFLVNSSIYFGRLAGLSDATIGVTIVAFGTSLPELATSTVAALRKESDIAIGNIVGSNIFNSFAILGVASTVAPLTIDPQVLRFEYPVMIAVSLALLPLAWNRRRLGRWQGAVLLAIYIGFTGLLLYRT